jgi:hypothetical protein
MYAVTPSFQNNAEFTAFLPFMQHSYQDPKLMLLLTSTYIPSSREIHSSEELVGSVENESPEGLGGVSHSSIPGGGAEAVISPEPLASSSASAKSWMLPKRS